ncbi:hypothetical protein K523DRAFT_65551 [Schizophyllum commune Tattone D]|nr:hypothetical protein K523DRAFT_65551 [Schizophyllum commune Tattone D]
MARRGWGRSPDEHGWIIGVGVVCQLQTAKATTIVVHSNFLLTALDAARAAGLPTECVVRASNAASCPSSVKTIDELVAIGANKPQGYQERTPGSCRLRFRPSSRRRRARPSSSSARGGARARRRRRCPPRRRARSRRRRFLRPLSSPTVASRRCAFSTHAPRDGWKRCTWQTRLRRGP